MCMRFSGYRGFRKSLKASPSHFSIHQLLLSRFFSTYVSNAFITMFTWNLNNAFFFGLTTLYELRSMTRFEKKELLIEVAKWSGDGPKTHCLKMPANWTPQRFGEILCPQELVPGDENQKRCVTFDPRSEHLLHWCWRIFEQHNKFASSTVKTTQNCIVNRVCASGIYFVK